MLAVGREVVLKLVDRDRWSLVNVVLTKLGEIRSLEPGKRLYQWSYLATGRPRDSLGLYPGGGGAGQMPVEEFLDTLQRQGE